MNTPAPSTIPVAPLPKMVNPPALFDPVPVTRGGVGGTCARRNKAEFVEWFAWKMLERRAVLARKG